RVAAAVGGSLRVGDEEEVEVRAVSTDGRRVRRGDLFVALSGERSDGHAFVQQAFDAGASGAMVSSTWDEPEDVSASRLVDVADTGRALLDLAADERSAMDARVVGVTG